MKNLGKYFFYKIFISSIIFAQDFNDIDQEIINFNFQEAKFKLEKFENNKHNIEILTRLSIVHHFLSESAENKFSEQKNTNKAYW